MGTRLKRVLHIPDVHSPWHDVCALDLMLQVAKDFKPDQVVILGDFFDFYSVSRHDKDPVKDYKLFSQELKEARETLELVIDKTNAKSYVFLEGNHERRLEKYISNNAPKLGGIFKSQEVLGLPNNFLYLPYGQTNYYKLGKLVCTHGARGGENPAASMVKKHRASVLFGHCHRIQEFHITNVNGEDFVALTPGWLGDQRKAAEYILDIADWSKGFGLTWHKDNGDFFYQLVKINDTKKSYECMFNSVVYQR